MMPLFLKLLLLLNVQQVALEINTCRKAKEPLHADAHIYAEKPPVVQWLTECDHDFQHMRREHPKSFIFRFKNIGAQNLLLQTVRTTCGCTAAKWTETPIEPGGTGEVEVEYDAYQPGEFSKKIRVFFDLQKKPEILWIRGEVD